MPRHVVAAGDAGQPVRGPLPRTRGRQRTHLPVEVAYVAALSRVRIVGTGLIGTSIGLAIRDRGVEVSLSDPSPTAVALAADLGAGRLATDDDPAPELIVVAAPPDVTGDVVAQQLTRFPQATVTDVASVKRVIAHELAEAGADASRYVGGHPMAGRERSGAISGRSDLFQGRPWVVVPTSNSHPGRVEQVCALAELAGAVVTRMEAAEHDAAVAAVSHVPQVAASLVASRLRELPTESVALAGQGLRDVTRIAASDPALWTQILVGNASAVRDILAELARDLGGVVAALDAIGDNPDALAPGARGVLAALVADGNAGHARIPGKHGLTAVAYGVVTVVVADEPGTVARLLHDIGAEGVNMEDLHIEHEVGRQVGMVQVSVVPQAVEPLIEALRRRGWNVRD